MLKNKKHPEEHKTLHPLKLYCFSLMLQADPHTFSGPQNFSGCAGLSSNIGCSHVSPLWEWPLWLCFCYIFITKFASMNHWQNMSKEIPSRYQVGRYGGLIYPWPRQHLLADPPEHLMLPPRQTGQNLFPSCISHQTHHFFAFVTVTACISSARMLSVVLLDYDTPLAVTDSFQSCAALSMTMAIL